MSTTNYTVSTLVNKVVWDIDDTSYGKALKRIKSLKTAQEKPAKALEQAQKRATQSEGKAQLQAAKAHTQRLKLAQRLGAEQQKQAQTAAKVAQNEQAHAKKMGVLNAKNANAAASYDLNAAKMQSRLFAINEKMANHRASRAARYTPSGLQHFGKPGEAYNPSLVDAQNAAMARVQSQRAQDIAATKRRIADQEKREASMKREVNYYNALRRSALTLSNINGADVATRYKAISAAKEALKAQKEERYTVEETRFEMARITQELRNQARLQNRITREQKAAGRRAGRVNTEKRGSSGAWLLAGGAVGAATLAGSMGISRAGGVLSESMERSRDVKKLEPYGFGQLQFAAIQDLAMSKAGYSLSADKLADLNKDTTEKAGELLNTGSFKKNKKTGAVNFSGGGEFADIINNVLTSTNGNQKVAQTVIGELQKMNFPDFIIYLKQLQKTFKWTDNQVRHLAEAVNDGSVFLSVFDDQGDAVIDRMKQLSKEGWALSQAQQANLDTLSSLGSEYARVQESLGDHFSASFVDGLGEYGKNTDSLRQGMAGLIPIVDGLGKNLGELAASVLTFTNWMNSLNPDNKHSQLSDNGAYYKDNLVGNVWGHIMGGIEAVTGASTIPGVQGMPSSTPAPAGSAISNLMLPANPGMSFNQMPTFSVPNMNDVYSRTPASGLTPAPLDVNSHVTVTVNDGTVKDLINARVDSETQRHLNLLTGVPQQ
ncbi:MAG: chemotaxis protein [Ewingella sp.]